MRNRLIHCYDDIEVGIDWRDPRRGEALSLYPILHSLEKDGLIAGEWEAAGPTKEKKIYKLTTKGRKSLEAISSEYRAFVGAFKNGRTFNAFSTTIIAL